MAYKIFISWSKNKSRLLAEATKKFLISTLGNSIEVFFSPDMYKGTCVDNEIHQNLINSNKCLVCITSDNFKNPWLLYEAGVVYGVNYSKGSDGIVIPILFEEIPDWSSWIDKPLNRYVPLQLQNSNGEFQRGKSDFKKFLTEVSKDLNVKLKQFNINWEKYEHEINSILKNEQSIPFECKYIVNKLLEKDDGCFSIISPEITKEHIVFHKGFTTQALMKILTQSITYDQSKYFWLYGRKNKKLLSRENEDFFKYLAEEGLNSGVDFRCMFPCPNTKATIKAGSRDREKMFNMELKSSIIKAYDLKNKFGLPVEKLFRLYVEPRKESIIRIDNAVLHRKIIRDSEGYPLPYTNASFEVLSGLHQENGSRGIEYLQKFESIWNDDSQSKPLTKELLEEII